MTARFAGSRSVGERRRRRLATGNDDASAAPSQRTREARARRRIKSRVAVLPLRKLIPRRAWKLWTLWLATVAFGAVLLALAQWAGRSAHPLAAVAGRVLGPSGDRAAVLFSCALLAVCGQLALLIRCVRARSAQDFGGRFAVWNWGALVFLCAAFGFAAGLQHAWGELVAIVWGLREESQRTLAWVVPALGGSAVLLWALLRDMDGCRSSSVVVQMAACCGCAAAVLQLEAFGVVPSHVRELAQNATCGLACAGLFLGLLLHAQYVVYRSADPPPSRVSLLGRLAARVRRATIFKRAAKAHPAETPSPEEQTTSSTARRQGADAARGARRTPRKPIVNELPADNVPAAGDEATAENRDVEETPAPVAKAPSPQPQSRPQMQQAPVAPSSVDEEDEDDSDSHGGQKLRLDPAHKDQLKGLSKRERRRLQKQWRDEERSGRP